MALLVGSRAPDFALRSQRGELVRLSEVTRDRFVVLYFYPRDETPGCTVEACSFRDSYTLFRDAGAEVIGISTDPVERHEAFAKNHELGFILLSDPDGSVRRQFEVADTIPFLIPGRETFVIDRQGIIRHRFSTQLRPAAHVREALAIVEKLAQDGSSTSAAR
jgi:peroxiredoxin Q/BCP